jgi:hypothetical protein
LHDRDQPHVAAEGVGHEHHRRRRPRRGPPDRRRARKHSQAREQIAEGGGENDHRANQGEEHRPSAKNRDDNVRRDGARDKTANETLSNNKTPGRNRHTPFEPAQTNRRADRAKHERRRQLHQFEGRDPDD